MNGHAGRGVCSRARGQLRFLGLSKVRPFVLHSLRHTFLTRLGQSGCDVWTLACFAGYSSIAISARYVHPSEDAVLEATERLGGHNSGHSAKLAHNRESGALLTA
jgi:integrase